MAGGFFTTNASWEVLMALEVEGGVSGFPKLRPWNSLNSEDSGITEGLVKMQILSLEGWGGPQASAYLTSSQFRVRLLI